VGVSDAPCFDEVLDPKHILNIRLINDAQLLELQTIYNYVEKRRIEGPWVNKLKQRIDAHGRQPDLMARLARKLSFRSARKNP
jgi:hypothetical protein